jgi:uncharacterized protein DUF6950
MKRSDWQKRFWGVINSSRGIPFAWGTHDCVTFAAKCVEAQIDDEYLFKRISEEFGTWSSAREASRAHRDLLNSCVCRMLGEHVAWTLLSMGDIAFAIDDRGMEFVCVHDGFQFVAPDASGLQKIPFGYIRHGWRIG